MSAYLAPKANPYSEQLKKQAVEGEGKAPSAPNLDSSNLEQLKSEAVALEGSKKHEEALAKYEEVLVIHQRDLPPGHLDTHETLTSIDRCIDQLKYASIDKMDVDKSAHSLLTR
jgi:hypothetical protein